MKNALKSAFWIVLITVCLLVLLEGSVRLFWNQEMRIEILSKNKRIMDFDSITYTFHLVPSSKYRVTKSEYAVEHDINSEGMRDFHTYLDKPRDSSKVRILAIGDSFTFGEGTDINDTWLARLERLLRLKGKAVEIVKAGVSAFDQWQEYKYLEKIIGIYKPDYVLLGFLPNDLLSNKPLDSSTPPSNLVLAGATGPVNFIGHLQMVNFAKKLLLYNDNLYRLAHEQYNGIQFLKKQVQNHTAIDHQYKVTARLLTQIDSLCRAYKAPLIVVSIPEFYEVIGSNKPGINIRAVDEYFAPVAKKNGFIWIPTLEEFQAGYKAGISTHYRIDEHLTPQGNEVLANALKSKLEILIK